MVAAETKQNYLNVIEETILRYRQNSEEADGYICWCKGNILMCMMYDVEAQTELA